MIGFIISTSTEPQKQKNLNKPISKKSSPTPEMGLLLPQENEPLILENAQE
jgi:hypothetical protein